MARPGRVPDGAVVLCAANNWDDVRLADRPLAEALARRVPVLYVDPPLSHLTPRNNPRVAPALVRPRLREAAPGVLRLTPVVTPVPFRGPVVPLTQALVRRALRRALTGTRVRAVVTTWLLVDVVDLARGARSAYWTQDDTASGAAHWGQDGARLLAGERRVADACDLVLAASPLMAERWRERDYPAHALPNGCDVDRFDTVVAPEPVDLPRPVAGFVGHLNQRTDLEYLRAVVDDGMSLLLVGPVSRSLAGGPLERLLRHDRVRAVGARPFEELPRWLAAMDVGLLPYRDDDFNRASFPLKTLEYLAAGLPVAATDLPAVRWLASPDVLSASDPQAFAAAARTAAGAGRARQGERRLFAKRHSWDERAGLLLDLLEGAGPQPAHP